MQKKHLHLQLTVLLLLLLGGCSSEPKSPLNPYLTGVKQLNVELTTANHLRAQWGDLSVGMKNLGDDTGLMVSSMYADGLFAGLLCTGQRGTGGEDTLKFRRTLRTIRAESGDGKSILDFCVLPQESGFSCYIEAAETSERHVILNLNNWPDGLPKGANLGSGVQPKWTEAGENIWVWPEENFRNPCLGIYPPPSDFAAASGDGTLDLLIPSDEELQIVLAFANDYKESIKTAKEYLRRENNEIENKTLETFSDRFAFQINTGDDNTNQAIALLQSSLMGAKQHLPFVTVENAEMMSDAAVGFFLNSRRQPMMIPFLREGDNIRGISGDELVLSSANAIRAVTQYGILHDTELSKFTSEIMASLTRLDASYTSEEGVILDPSIHDTLMQKAISYIRFADLMKLGQELSMVRGQSTPSNVYRRKSLDAAKLAQDAFRASYRDYRDARLIDKAIQQAKERRKDSEEAEEIDPLKLPDEGENKIHSSYPDTTAFLQAGARFGFNYLSHQPEEYVEQSSYWTPYLWQRWVRHRFEKSSSLFTTSDSDSLFSVLLEGPVPGMLTDGNQPDLAASIQALRNISEIYLGIQPDWADSKITINPRMPKSWERTAARVPLGPGFLYVEYDFLNERATLRIENIHEELGVLFYYPLPSEKTLRAQFKLAESRPEVTLFITRDRGNRMNLEIE